MASKQFKFVETYSGGKRAIENPDYNLHPAKRFVAPNRKEDAEEKDADENNTVQR
jgi:hypothetical protein